MQSFLRIIVICISCLILGTPVRADMGIKGAMVKIYTVYNRSNYDAPWQMIGQQRRSGSGCIISGKRILTNAHVIGDQTFIQVRRAGEAKKYTAEVGIVAHECDLAILTVNDDSFFSDVAPIEIGELSDVRDKVTVYGFPKGGDKLSITEGVVSRVEHHRYAHSNAHLLTCQIDAAINPGNSGGPVIKDNKLVGVAFQAVGVGQNIGYMVPVPIINHFLTDIKDGKYDGIPGLGISWQKMENPALRYKFGMNKKINGALINKISPDSPARGILKRDDIIIAIDGKNIENDGTIEFRKGERTSFNYIIQKKFMNEKVTLKILSENHIRNIKITLSKPMSSGRLVPYERYDQVPTYYIVGGFVFEPLTVNFLKTWGEKWKLYAPNDLLNYYDNGKLNEDKKEIVVLVKVLADEINTGYFLKTNCVISYANGKKISNMRDLVYAFEKNKGRYHVITDKNGYKIVLDKNKVDQNNERILKRYKIACDRSRDLKEVPQRVKHILRKDVACMDSAKVSCKNN